MSATFTTHDIKCTLQQKRKLSAYLDTLLKTYRTEVNRINLEYIFCSDEYLLTINQRYLDHDTYTDIITFDLSEGKHLVGEIYISVERVRANAEAFKVPFNQELHRIIFHGALHLCGFGDKSKKDKAQMTLLENKCLQEYLNSQNEA